MKLHSLTLKPQELEKILITKKRKKEEIIAEIKERSLLRKEKRVVTYKWPAIL